MPHEKPHDSPRKLTEDMPLGARIGMNIILAAAPPTLRRHAIRHLEAGPRPIRKTRAERQREWEIEQARRAREETSRSDWTPQSSSPCPWDEDEASGSDSETTGVESLCADKEEQVETTQSWAPPMGGGESCFFSRIDETDIPSRSSQPPGFTRESSQNPPNNQLRGGRREPPQQGRNKKKRKDTPPPIPMYKNLTAEESSGSFPPVEPDGASMTTGYQRIWRWSNQVDGIPDDLLPVEDGRASVSTAWPGPHTDAGDDVGPGESISVIGDEAEDEGLYRRGKIAPSSRESAKPSESTKWTV